MKQCYRCGEVRPTSEFYKNRAQHDGLYPLCKACTKEKNDAYSRQNGREKRVAGQQRDRNRKFLFEYLSTHPCVDCLTDDIRVLEFDHLPEYDKIDGVAKIAKSASLLKLKAEIAKCEVRCRNCHTIKTYERLGKTWHDQFLEANND